MKSEKGLVFIQNQGVTYVKHSLNC